MTINTIAFIPPVSMPELASTNLVVQPANFSLMSESSAISEPSGQFANWFSQQLAQVNDQLKAADHGIHQLAVGDASSLHQVMIDLEQAKLSMQLVMQVRNHLLDAYREVLQMQV